MTIIYTLKKYGVSTICRICAVCICFDDKNLDTIITPKHKRLQKRKNCSNDLIKNDSKKLELTQ